MDYVAEEIRAVLNGDLDRFIMHYGMPRRSGRYPWGSGENPYQHSMDFMSRVELLKKSGWTETPENIRKEFGLSTTEYRTQKRIATNERRLYLAQTIRRMKEKEGMTATEIGRELGLNESTVRSILNSDAENRANAARQTADFIKQQIDKRGMIDVGTGVERELNISKEKLQAALQLLEEEGYVLYGGRIPQVTNPGQMTTLKVICPPGTEHKEIYDTENVHSLTEYISRDGGDTYEKKFTYPESMDSSRLMIRYSEDGGIEKDGVIELRRGVDDLSLGESHYAQVRILVDGTHYLKGMAVYSDDMPDGVDVIFNTNKTKGTPMTSVLKEIKDDPNNPFGSLIKDANQGGQYWYTDSEGNKKLGLINKRAEEGDWTEWKDTLPSQFLSKQSLQLAQKQLGLAVADKTAEFDEINSLTNPTLKKYLLQKFADECDSAAVHLQAAALPGQKYHVILPVSELKDNEVYAPGYEEGTKLALIRYPHGGTFEIPIVTVVKNKVAEKMIGKTSIDAICINSNVAARLSGADFDGDTVMAIPTSSKIKITSTPALKDLEGFDPKTSYPEREGMKYMTKRGTQTQMGIISNLITDMTLKGASDEELARAVKHSMVVIDAYKHKLDYKASEIDNGIASLKKIYQSYVDSDGTVKSGGASTLISRAKSEISVIKRQGSALVNMIGKAWYDPSKSEGSLVYKTADDATYQVTNKKTGETVTKTRTQPSTKMAETDNAYTLVSEANTPMERAYADFANKMKALANEARKTIMSTGKIQTSTEAKKTFASEVSSLMAKLNTALLNAPREREAQRRANTEVAAAKENDPDMTREDEKKLSQQALSRARESVSSVSRSERSITITDKEWDAIQAGAISESKLNQILNNTDIDALRQRATPKTSTGLSSAKIAMIKSMSASNYSLAEIARKLGVSTSTVSYYLKGGN